MRLFGFLFILILIIAAVGFFRGWFSITTSHAGGRNDVTLGIDRDKIDADTTAATGQLDELSAKAVGAVKSLGTTAGTGDRVLEGTVTVIDLPKRHIVVTVGSDTIELTVPVGVAITRNSASIGLEELTPATPARVTFQLNGGNRLTRIEILQ